MLLNTIVIVAHEVIESATVACLLIALVNVLALPTRWLWAGLALGLLLAATYAGALETISAWGDYRGQELFSIGVHLVMFGLIVTVAKLTRRGSAADSPHRLANAVTIVLLFALSLTLELSEIALYLSAYRHAAESIDAILLGTVIGAVVGVSLAVLGYYSLMQLPAEITLRAVVFLLALLGGGLLSQSVVFLMQIDLLPSHSPLWNSSNVISETSIIGQLLVAVFRYETQPTLLQLIAYLAGFGAILGAALHGRFNKPG